MTARIRRFGLALGTLVIASALAAGVYTAVQNNAGGPPPFRGPRMGMAMRPLAPLRMMAARLGLSDAQKQQVKDIVKSRRADWKALADRAAAARQTLRAAVAADPIDEGAIRAASASVAAVEADVAVATAHARTEVFQVLTPDQQAQARALEAQMHQRLGKMRQRLGQGH